jgi:hypothetical protein
MPEGRTRTDDRSREIEAVHTMSEILNCNLDRRTLAVLLDLIEVAPPHTATPAPDCPSKSAIPTLLLIVLHLMLLLVPLLMIIWLHHLSQPCRCHRHH